MFNSSRKVIFFVFFLALLLPQAALATKRTCNNLSEDDFIEHVTKKSDLIAVVEIVDHSHTVTACPLSGLLPNSEHSEKLERNGYANQSEAALAERIDIAERKKYDECYNHQKDKKWTKVKIIDTVYTNGAEKQGDLVTIDNWQMAVYDTTTTFKGETIIVLLKKHKDSNFSDSTKYHHYIYVPTEDDNDFINESTCSPVSIIPFYNFDKNKALNDNVIYRVQNSHEITYNEFKKKYLTR